MSITIKTYPEYLASMAKASKEYVGDHCFVAGCTNPPPYYRAGDARFWCGMCEEHAEMRKSYLSYIRTKLQQCGLIYVRSTDV